MLNHVRRFRSGFTLTELAIVLAIVGVLAAGLYQLISGANQQSRDSTAAGEQDQLISAVKGYLNSSGVGSGQAFMQSMAAVTAVLPLPTSAHAAGSATCKANLPLDTGLCDFLPPGFSSDGTTNSYNQNYSIHINDPTFGQASSPAYSFMILTSGGSPIPDASGARISSLIGGDGGFVYSNNVCTAVNSNHTACGASGAWSADINATYGFGYPATGGFVASRSFVGNSSNANYTWLDREVMPTDVGSHTPVWNTMSTDLFLGGHVFYLGADSTPGVVTGGGTVDMQGGTINMQAGTVNIGGGTIKGAENANISVDLETSGSTLLTSTAGYNSFVFLQTRCSVDATASLNDATLTANANCMPGIQDHGDANFGGRVNVNSLYATTFIYQGSDIRLKTNVHLIADPLGDVMKLKPVSYTFKTSGKEGLGVVAQDLEKIYPQLVSERDDGIKAVNYEGLIAPLIGAVQELKHENDDLRQQIKDQAAHEKTLEQKFRAKSAE